MTLAAGLGAGGLVAGGAIGLSEAATKPCHARRHHPCPKPCHQRQHHKCPKARPHKPVTPPPLPSRLEVDENDQGQLPQPYSLAPSHNPVAAGRVEFNVYNFGMDDHTFAIRDASGRQISSPVSVPSGQSQNAVVVDATLPPGTYTLYCTLKAGQPDSHFVLGMHAALTVR